jgi:hypothetical protein
MRSAAAAIGWELWGAQRRPLQIAIGILLAEIPLFAVVMAFSRAPGALILSLLPATQAVAIILNAFVYSGERAGQLAVGLPRRLFVLPVPTVQLVAWPMLYGLATSILVWLYLALVVLRPHGFPLPLWAPALAAAAFLWWAQAFSWCPLGNPWINLAVTFAGLASLSGIVVAAWVWLGGSEAPLCLLLIAYLAAAFAYALFGVHRDRRGEGRVRGASCRAKAATAPYGRIMHPFRSGARAQLWHEWRLHGLGLPCYCGGLLLVSFPLMLTARTPDGGATRAFLILSLSVPIIATGAVSSGLAKLSDFFAPSWTVPTYLASRPLSSAGFVAAKLKMTLLSVLLTWVAVVAIAAIWLVVCRADLAAMQKLPAWTPSVPVRPGWWLVAVPFGLVLVSWRQYTSALWHGLSGRAWMSVVSVVLYLVPIAVAAGLFIANPYYPRLLPQLIKAAPWILGAAFVARAAFVSAAYIVAFRMGLLGARTAISVVAGWFLVVCALVFAASSAVPATPLQLFVIVLAVGLAVPLGRFPACIVALHWNRHR